MNGKLRILRVKLIKEETTLENEQKRCSPQETHDVAIAAEGALAKEVLVDPTQVLTTCERFFSDLDWFSNATRKGGRDHGRTFTQPNGNKAKLPVVHLPYPKHVVMIAIQYYSRLPKIYQVHMRDLSPLLSLADYIGDEKFSSWICKQLMAYVLKDPSVALDWLEDGYVIPSLPRKDLLTQVSSHFCYLTNDNLKKISPSLMVEIVPMLEVSRRNLDKIQLWYQQLPNKESLYEKLINFNLVFSRFERAFYLEEDRQKEQKAEKKRGYPFKLSSIVSQISHVFMPSFPLIVGDSSIGKDIMQRRLRQKLRALVPSSLVVPVLFPLVDLEQRYRDAHVKDAPQLLEELDQLRKSKRDADILLKSMLKRGIRQVKSGYAGLLQTAKNTVRDENSILHSEREKFDRLNTQLGEQEAGHKARMEDVLKRRQEQSLALEPKKASLMDASQKRIEELNQELLATDEKRDLFFEEHETLTFDNPNV